jgi:hypothetical protein
LVVAVQITLAAGAPWGALAYGGRPVQDDGRLPIRYRWSSAAAAVLLAGAAWLVLAAGGVVDRAPVPASALEGGAWVLAGCFPLTTVGNVTGGRSVPTTAGDGPVGVGPGRLRHRGRRLTGARVEPVQAGHRDAEKAG